jgi:hypothetical protein
MDARPFIVYSGPGVYEPYITPGGTVWRRNTNGDPFMGICVETIRSIRKWAEIVRIETPQGIEQQEQANGFI